MHANGAWSNATKSLAKTRDGPGKLAAANHIVPHRDSSASQHILQLQGWMTGRSRRRFVHSSWGPAHLRRRPCRYPRRDHMVSSLPGLLKCISFSSFEASITFWARRTINVRTYSACFGGSATCVQHAQGSITGIISGTYSKIQTFPALPFPVSPSDAFITCSLLCLPFRPWAEPDPVLDLMIFLLNAANTKYQLSRHGFGASGP